MNSIETIICLLLLFMAVPDVCTRLGRPSLIYSAFVIFGFILGPLVAGDVAAMLQKAGEVGFLLLLFEVGLEIDLPRFKKFLPSLRFALGWSLFQYPVIVALAIVTGLTVPEGLLAAAALTGCSVGMGYPAWKSYPGLTEEMKPFVLQVMVGLEMLGIVILAADAIALEKGFHWLVLLKLAGITVAILLISRYTTHLVTLFQRIIDRTTHWRVHLMVLLVFGVCAVGERLGLAAAKTAFFLGLFMSHARHNGLNLEQHMAPISQRFLIPLFFVSLGLQIEWSMLLSYTGLLAFCSAFFLLGFRELMSRRFFKVGGDKNSFLLLCPNLTIVALGARALFESHTEPQLAAWLIMTGLFISVTAILLLPGSTNGKNGPVTTTAPSNS